MLWEGGRGEGGEGGGRGVRVKRGRNDGGEVVRLVEEDGGGAGRW